MVNLMNGIHQMMKSVSKLIMATYLIVEIEMKSPKLKKLLASMPVTVRLELLGKHISDYDEN